MNTPLFFYDGKPDLQPDGRKRTKKNGFSDCELLRRRELSETQQWWETIKRSETLGLLDALAALAFCRWRKLRTLEIEPQDRPCGALAVIRHQTLFWFLV